MIVVVDHNGEVEFPVEAPNLLNLEGDQAGKVPTADVQFPSGINRIATHIDVQAVRFGARLTHGHARPYWVVANRWLQGPPIYIASRACRRRRWKAHKEAEKFLQKKRNCLMLLQA